MHLLIAVVDDEEPVRRSMERLLRSAGYDVATFAAHVRCNRPRRNVTIAARMGRLRILYVEDQAEAREAVEHLLRHNGHDVRGVGGMAEALAAAALEHFDLLIADVNLPDGDGCELLIQLRRSHRTLRAIAVTGHDRDELREVCRAAGFSEFLIKPVLFPKLLATIEAAMT